MQRLAALALYLLTQLSVLVSAFVVALLLTSAAQAQQVKFEQEGQGEKNWQQMLFHFYQGDYAQALMQLAVAEQRGLPQAMQHNALLAKGSLSLVQDMPAQAEAQFRALAQSAEPEHQAQAWYWLAKAYFASEQYPQALAAISEAHDLKKRYAEAEWQELVYMQAQTQLQNPQLAQGNDLNRWTTSLASNSPYRPYLFFNQGLQHFNAARFTEALAAFASSQTALANAQPPSWWRRWFVTDSPLLDRSERLGLQDMLALSSGYVQLANKDAVAAAAQFAAVRFPGKQATSALLGYAEALAAQGELGQALAYWQKLVQEHPATPAGLNALYQMIWQFAQAGDEQQALERILLGEQHLAEAALHTAELSDWVAQPEFVSALHRYQQAQNLPTASLSSAQKDLLMHMLSSMQGPLKHWSELTTQQQQLAHQQQDLTLFGLLLDERVMAVKGRAEQLDLSALNQQVENLREQMQALEQRLAQATSEPALLADSEQLAILERLRRAEQRLARLQQHPRFNQYATRVARARGLLQWQLSEQAADNHWRHTRQWQALKTLLDETEQRQGRLAALLQQTPDYASDYARVQSLQRRVAQQQQKVGELRLAFAEQIRTQAQWQIAKRQEQLARYDERLQLVKLQLQDKPATLASTHNSGGQQ